MDINEIFEDVEEVSEPKKPSLEEIKKIVDSKRLKARTPSKTYTKEDRIRNLELARERKKITVIKPVAIPEPKQVPIQDNNKEDKFKENLNISNPIPIINNTFNNDLFNEIKELILNQNQILSNLNIKPAKKPKTIKKQIERKTLDLTITDNEIKNIIDNNNSNNNKNNEPKVDAKLQEFLNAFKRY
jgi:hypothetical protein